eukprot:5073891-Lingulodinium_polyedra.AAC.1
MFTRMCGWGARWRRPARLLTNGLLWPERLSRFCRVWRARLLCQCAGLPRIVLQGRDVEGRVRASVAQAYPRRLARVVAR